MSDSDHTARAMWSLSLTSVTVREDRFMGRLLYTTICSFDGYINDAEGSFAWAEPDAEVHGFVNDRERAFGTYLYGRRLYETMRIWEDDVASWDPDPSPEVVEYAEIWRAADKAVFSTALTDADVTTARTSLYRTVDVAAINAMKELSDRPLEVGGATLAAEFLRAGLVDEFAAFLVPHIVGGGAPALPDDLRRTLTLREHRTFGNGTVFLRYDVTN